MSLIVRRRNILGGAAAGGVFGAAWARSISGAAAQPQWPARPIRIIVPYPAGISADVIVRAMLEPLSQRLQQPVVVDNRPGAGGMIGTAAAANSAPDGYTLVLTTETSIGVIPQIHRRAGYDPFTSLTPVIQLSRMPWYMVCGPRQPFQTVGDLISAARSRPDAISFGTNGVGGGGHVRLAMLMSLTNTSMVHVPYTVSPVSDVVANTIPVAFEPTASAIPLIRAGTVRGLGITSVARDPVMPDVPPIGDSVPGFDADGWLGLHAPAGTPDPILDRLAQEIAAVIRAEAFRARLLDLGAHVLARPRDEFLAVYRQEYAMFTRLIRDHNIRAEG